MSDTIYKSLIQMPVGVLQVSLFNNQSADDQALSERVYKVLKASLQAPDLKPARLQHLIVAALTLTAEAAVLLDEQKAAQQSEGDTFTPDELVTMQTTTTIN